MKKKTVLFLLLFLFIFLLYQPSVVSAQVGTNIANYDRYPEVIQVLKSYGVTTATVLIDIGCAQDTSCLQQRKQDSQAAGISTLVLRVSEGSSNELAISADAAAKAGSAVAQVFPGTLVEFGNEVNNINFGWRGGTGSSYIDALAAFANAASGRIQVLAAALDPIFSGSGGFSADDFIKQFYAPNAGRLGNVAGFAFNAYESGDWVSPCSANADIRSRSTRCSWIWLSNVYSQYGMSRGIKVLTEYSLIPGKDGDLTKVIKFIDETKNQMLGLGARVITPLIKNQCKAQDKDQWDWLIFVNGSPSRIVSPSGIDMSSRVCSAVSDTAKECDISKVGNVGSSGIGSIFSNLLSLFASVIPWPAPEIVTNVVNSPLDALQTAVAPNSADAYRWISYVLPNSPGNAKVATYVHSTGATTYGKVEIPSVNALFSGDGMGRDNYSFGWLRGFTTSSLSEIAGDIGSLMKQTARFWYGGNYSLDFQADLCTLKNSTVKDPEILKRALSESGAWLKLWPAQSIVRIGSDYNWKGTGIAYRDRTVACVIRAYICGKFGRNCDEDLCMDFPAGYVNSAAAAQNNSVSSSSNNNNVLPATKGATWFNFGYAGGRDFFTSEIACKNPYWGWENIDKSDKVAVCQDLGYDAFGVYSGGGAICEATTKKYGAGHCVGSPADDALFGAGCGYGAISTSNVTDIGTGNPTNGTGVFDTIHPADADGEMNNQASIPAANVNTIPGGFKAWWDYLRRLRHVFFSPDDNNKVWNEMEDVPAVQCPNVVIAGEGPPDAYAGFQINQIKDKNTDAYVPAKRWTLEQTIDDIKNALNFKRKPYHRDGSIEVPIAKDVRDSTEFCGGKKGLVRAFLPYADQKKLDTTIGGLKLWQLPGPRDYQCKSTIECDKLGLEYGVGGDFWICADPKNSLLAEIILPYNPKNKASASRAITSIANGKIPDHPLFVKRADNPFLDLASVVGSTEKIDEQEKTITITNPWSDLQSLSQNPPLLDNRVSVSLR